MTNQSKTAPPNEDLARKVLEHSVDGLLVIDSQGIVQFANPAASALFERQTGQLVGFHVGIPAGDDSVEMILPGGDGARFVEMRSTEIEWEGKTANLASLRDITGRRQAEEALQNQAQELQQRNNELVRFNRVLVGRELRMIELKQEVNELHQKLGEPQRYRYISLAKSSDPTPSPKVAFSPEETYRRYLESLLAGDSRQCREIFEQWLESVPLRDLYQDLVQRSLYEVGELWEQGRISVAAEHLATAITESLLTLAQPRLLAQPRAGKSAVVACISREHHQMGGRIVADLLELRGWHSYFLGANVPLSELKALVDEKRPNVVVFSATIAANVDIFIDTVNEIRDAFPSTPMLAGGQAFRHKAMERARRLPGVQYLASLQDLENWIGEFEPNV
jgi:methanogenic corrinoid protein MtbC1